MGAERMLQGIAASSGQGSPTPLPPPVLVGGGLVAIKTNSHLQAEAEKKQAELANNQPIISSLAAHVRQKWQAAYQAKLQTAEPRMLASIRARRGEYDPDKLNEIRKTGGDIATRLEGLTRRVAAPRTDSLRLAGAAGGAEDLL